MSFVERLKKKVNEHVASDHASRMDICRACPSFIKATTQCRECGCFMAAKTKLKTATCPLGKW